MINLARLVAPETISVLLFGDTGTGKEVLARAIHRNSPRGKGPFVSLNCAAIPEALAESELFGHVKGAFTGAVQTRKGRFELADHGTLFLDEIGELPLPLQAKLLRAIEYKVITPVGGTNTIAVDCRILSATNRNLQEEVEQKRFRDDLFYRLHGFPIRLPALRDRPDDLPALCEHFMQKHSPGDGRTIDVEVLSTLQGFEYQGNIRQLENMIQYALIVAGDGPLRLEHFPMLQGRKPVRQVMTMAEAEKQAIEAALEATDFNRAESARLLGISRPTLYRKIEEYKIPMPGSG